jgi:hypothetical protein
MEELEELVELATTSRLLDSHEILAVVDQELSRRETRRDCHRSELVRLNELRVRLSRARPRDASA